MNIMFRTFIIATSAVTRGVTAFSSISSYQTSTGRCISSVSVSLPCNIANSQIHANNLIQRRDFSLLAARGASPGSYSRSKKKKRSTQAQGGTRNKNNNSRSAKAPNRSKQTRTVTARRSNQSQSSQKVKRIRNESNTNASRVKLPEPDVLWSSNHLVFINKPAGYHSQPNESIEQKASPKCLLSKLKSKELGGGSAKNFLLPMHRLDQPCTGILCLAKTSKAGTRIGNAFRKHVVEKDYFCVVEGNLNKMIAQSEMVSRNQDGKEYRLYKLSGVLSNKKGGKGKGNGSVSFKPYTPDMKIGDQRVCDLEWEHLRTVHKTSDGYGVHLVRCVTGTGAKHQVRAMLSQLAKSPVCGDLRYGASQALPDQSVALHARSLYFPTVSLGESDLKTIVAPIPNTWARFFSLREKDIPKR